MREFPWCLGPARASILVKQAAIFSMDYRVIQRQDAFRAFARQ